MLYNWKSKVRPDILEALSIYIPMLDNMPENLRDNLFLGFYEMEKLKSYSFAYRVIEKDGKSAVFSTNRFWPLYFANEPAVVMREHMNLELPKLLQQGHSLVTRTGDKCNTPYLQALEKFRLNNSVVKYKLEKSQIKIYYFMIDYYDKNSRDTVIHNLQRLENIAYNIQPSLDYIVQSKAFNDIKQLIVSKDIIKNCFKSPDYKRVNGVSIMHPNGEIFLSQKEARVLSLFNIGVGGDKIARRLNISPHTVKRHIDNIKNKMAVSTRSEMIDVIDQSCVNLKEILLEVI